MIDSPSTVVALHLQYTYLATSGGLIDSRLVSILTYVDGGAFSCVKHCAVSLDRLTQGWSDTNANWDVTSRATVRFGTIVGVLS